MDRLLFLTRALSWAGVWALHLCVLVTYPTRDLAPPDSCGHAALRAAARCGWVCAAARLSGAGMPLGMATMAAVAAAAPAAEHCLPPGRALLKEAAAKGYPAGCACAGLGALLAAYRASRREAPSAEGGDGASAASSWHPLGSAMPEH
jgi:hypothetical protein